MRVKAIRANLAEVKADLAACFAFEGDQRPRGVRDKTLEKELAAEMRAERFKAGAGDVLVWNTNGRYACRRYLVVGLGEEGNDARVALRAAAAKAIRVAERQSADRVAIGVPPVGDAGALARATAEGALLGGYRFDRYLSDPRKIRAKVKQVELAVDAPVGGVRKPVGAGEVVARAVCLARDLVNEPPSEMNPGRMSRVARAEAKKAGLQARVLGVPELKKLGMNALLAVARGSSEPARVVHMTYKPKGKSKGRVVLVGKGVTFDSGGLNLKPGNFMLHMKSDMGGAAAVLATMTALGEIGCKYEVHALLGLVENMTGAAAYKPGDILRTYSGKTVEIGNTDAEGRLVLADLMAYAAKRLKPDHMIDVATLTGAVVVALGPHCIGAFSRDDAFCDALVEAGRSAGETLWRMPMFDDYLDLLKDGPADLTNVGGRYGGAITAALFLGEMIPREQSWIHLDIAGPAFYEKETAEVAFGGSGAGVRTLLGWFESASR